MAKRKREQITLWVLPETNEKIVRLADKELSTKSGIVDGLVKKAKEPADE